MFSVRCCWYFVAVVSAVYSAADEQYKVVETLNGRIRGVRQITLLKEIPYYSFKGIPYAKPPVNDLRFKPPQPVDHWNNVLDAFEHSNVCVQPKKLIPNELPQSEDCLTLNIYVPAHVKPNEKLATLFYIHGGGYAEGTGDDYFYGPDFLVEKQTIVVTINYRLGLLGFLSLDTPEYSGNMGLKDQQLALKWISENIEKFGGDSKRITIFGESAGGSSVHFHILSTESRKYFRNAAPMSGVAGNYWAMSEQNNHLELAHKIAADFGEPKKNNEELVAFLKSAPADKLSEYSTVTSPNILFEIPFTPVIERDDAEQPFLTEYPKKIYEKTQTDFDVLFTMTSAVCVTQTEAEFLGLLSLVPPLETVRNAELEQPLPFKGLRVPVDEQRVLTKKIREFYFNGNGSGDSLEQYVHLLSDINFSYEIDKTVKTHAAKSIGKTFYTVFSIDSKLNGFKLQNPTVAHVPGASHCDELFYLFRWKSAQSLYDEVLSNRKDKTSKISLKVIDNITNLFTNFAKYSDLSLKNNSKNRLQPVQGDKVHFLDVNNDGFRTGLDPKKESFDFLADIEQQALSLSLLQPRDEL